MYVLVTPSNELYVYLSRCISGIIIEYDPFYRRM